MYWVINRCCNLVWLFRQIIAQSHRNPKVLHELQSCRVRILEFGEFPLHHPPFKNALTQLQQNHGIGKPAWKFMLAKWITRMWRGAPGGLYTPPPISIGLRLVCVDPMWTPGRLLVGQYCGKKDNKDSMWTSSDSWRSPHGVLVVLLF